MASMARKVNMRFSNTVLMVLTPIGLAIGLHEAWRLTGGLVVLLAAQVLVLALVAAALVRTIRREEEQVRAARESSKADGGQ